MSQGVPTPIPDCHPADRPGKPTLCTDALIAAVYDYVRAGGYPTCALTAAGISDTQHSYWLRRAAEDIDKGIPLGSSVYARYAEAVKRAEAEAEAEMVKCVREAAQAGPQYWAAGATYLERRHPDRWGKRERQEPPQHATVVNIMFAPFSTPTNSPQVSPVVEVQAPQLPAGEPPSEPSE